MFGIGLSVATVLDFGVHMLQDTLAREVELKVVVLFAFFLAGYSPVKFKPIVVVTYMAVTMNFEWCLLYTVKLQVSNSA